MESIALDMDDMFDNRMDHDDDDRNYGHRRGLPDLETDEQQPSTNDGAEADEVLANLKNLKGAAKKKTSRPQPKLDSVRLQTDRGLAALPPLFSKVKFKGRGHETEDLTVMMNKLEHWAHRLFPKLSFDDFIERLERLGNKREIQTCLKRIRLDMPMLPTDIVDDDLNENKDNEVTQVGENNGNSGNDLMEGMNVDEAYDAMMRRERESAGISTTPAPSTAATATSSAATATSSAATATSSAASSIAQSSQTNLQQASLDTSLASQGLTPEQRERIERNRRMAMEKRAQRLGIPISQVVTENITTPPVSRAPQSEVRDLGIESESDVRGQGMELESKGRGTESESKVRGNGMESESEARGNGMESESEVRGHRMESDGT